MISFFTDLFTGLWTNVITQPTTQLVAMLLPLAVLARWWRTTPSIWLAFTFAALMPVPVIAILLAVSL